MGNLSGRERVLIVLGVAAALAIGAWVYVVDPLLGRARAAAERAPVLEARLERHRQLLTQRERITRELEETRQLLSEAGARLLPGSTAPLAASELQKLVKEVADGAGVEVRSERVLAPVELTGFQEVPIELTVAGSVRETVALLHHLERTPRLLALKDIKFRVVAVGQPKELLTTLTVSGYIAPTAAAPKPDARPATGGQR